MNLLITGGAGFIGSHFCKIAVGAGHLPVTFDNLSTGHRRFVKFGPLVVGDVRDPAALKRALQEFQIEAVVHFAGKALVGESMVHPEVYFSNNTVGVFTVLEAMRQTGVSKLIFSSSCATYGVPDEALISEGSVQRPINPYGRSKLQGEEMILAYQQIHGFSAAILRYFNVVGQDPDGELWEDHEPETHILPNILKSVGSSRPFSIFGTDYPTPDGTCVRDYVDVNDLARVHLAALNELSRRPLLVSNVGRGRGYSVRQVLAAVERVCARSPEVVVRERRPGDPPELVADNAFFQSWYKDVLRPLEASIESVWRGRSGTEINELER